MRLVDLREYVPDALFDLRYATVHNIVGKRLYAEDFRAQLDRHAAEHLAMAAKIFRQQGLRLVIWDAHRPPTVQSQLLAVEPDQKYVLEESNHCRGLAVDITLADADGELLDMGTDHDDFTPRAHVGATDLTSVQQANRHLLCEVMTATGFTQWPYEWWHFDANEKRT